LRPNLALILFVSSIERLSDDDDIDGGGGGVRLGGGGVFTSFRDILGGGGTNITSSSKIINKYIIHLKYISDYITIIFNFLKLLK